MENCNRVQEAQFPFILENMLTLKLVLLWETSYAVTHSVCRLSSPTENIDWLVRKMSSIAIHTTRTD